MIEIGDTEPLGTSVSQFAASGPNHQTAADSSRSESTRTSAAKLRVVDWVRAMNDAMGTIALLTYKTPLRF